MRSFGDAVIKGWSLAQLLGQLEVCLTSTAALAASPSGRYCHAEFWLCGPSEAA
jgi:hypothetical protein